MEAKARENLREGWETLVLHRAGQGEAAPAGVWRQFTSPPGWGTQGAVT